MAEAKLFFEDVRIGTEIPPKSVLCDVLSQVKWAGVNRDYDPEHWDREHALSLGLPGCIVNGQYKVALLTNVILNWIGETGSLRRLSCEQRRMDMVGEPIRFAGRVVACREAGGENLVDCEVWAENPKGEKTVVGSATVNLPGRPGQQTRR